MKPQFFQICLTLASLVLLALLVTDCQSPQFTYSHGAIIRGDSGTRKIALVFTGDEYADGGESLLQVLDRHRVKASFFLTGKFYRNPEFKQLVHDLVSEGHYLGAHSDQHLLYCDWTKRDSLLVTRNEFQDDLEANYQVMSEFGIGTDNAPYFLPPYEWYNDSIAAWTRAMDLVLVNHTPGTLSAADYTLPENPGYRSNQEIYQSILEYEESTPEGLNGFLLLTHIGTHPDRSEKFYLRMDELISELKHKGYQMVRIDELLKQ